MDRIDAPELSGDGMARDVISFGAGITAQTLQFTRGQSSVASGHADLIIAYSVLDSVTLSPGAFSEIAEIRFADGSRLGRGEILRIVAADAVASGDQFATHHYGQNNQTLVGGALADRLSADEGNNVLIGGGGNDMLGGGRGRNTDVVAADSGADQIRPHSRLGG